MKTTKERRDAKNRILNKGEYQKPDGRYMYKYKDYTGKDCFVYSWTLTKSDRAPKGKEGCKCLRELEAEIAKDVMDKIDSRASKKLTLNELWDNYVDSRSDWRESTKCEYMLMYNKHVRNGLGIKRIADIKYSSIKKLYIDMLYNEHLAINTVAIINRSLYPVFKTAVRDGYIRTNPVEGVLSELKKTKNYKETTVRHALTLSEQNIFMQCVKESQKQWIIDITIFMLGTGCRIGETTALKWGDCDFENGIISIRRSIAYIGGDQRFVEMKPKTKAGIRNIPMLNEVRDMLKYLEYRQKCCGKYCGEDGTVFLNSKGGICMKESIEKAFKKIVRKYNESELQKAKFENREPKLLPNVTPHILRHTFCTRFCENETNIKVIQEIMGHSSISVTMDIYTEATKDAKQDAFKNLEGKIKL